MAPPGERVINAMKRYVECNDLGGMYTHGFTVSLLSDVYSAMSFVVMF